MVLIKLKASMKKWHPPDTEACENLSHLSGSPLVETSIKAEALIISDELVCPALLPSWLLGDTPSGNGLISKRLGSIQGLSEALHAWAQLRKNFSMGC